MPKLTQQSLWEGGPILHTEMLDIMHMKTLGYEVTPCIKRQIDYTTLSHS